MKKILLIGNSPLPDENTKSRPAAGLRTFQFLKPLLRKGGTVIKSADKAFSSSKKVKYKLNVVCIAMPECYEDEPKQKEIRHPDGYTQLVISKNDPELLRRIQELHDELHPDAVVAVNTYPSYIASQLDSRSPLWCDLNGWVMAEAQAQAYKMESNDYLSHYYKMERSILERADKLSAVSEAQRFALVGELACFGRLNNESFGYEYVHHIPNGIEWFEGEREDSSNSEPSAAGPVTGNEVFSHNGPEGPDCCEKNTLHPCDTRSISDIPEDSFILLWLGGYNTWVDEITLYKGVEAAMEECEKLYFVSTGGDIKGLDNKTFAKFKEMIDKSKYKDRFIFLGWVDTEDIPYIYSRADCGLNVDRRCVETLTGARNRINEMMKFGLPIVTTLGSEISYEVGRAGAGIGVKTGKYGKLAEAIASIYKEWRGGGERASEKYKEYGKNGQKYISRGCTYEEIMVPLLKWLENPRPALDRKLHLNLNSGLNIKSTFRYIKENGVKRFFKKLYQKVRFLF